MARVLSDNQHPQKRIKKILIDAVDAPALPYDELIRVAKHRASQIVMAVTLPRMDRPHAVVDALGPVQVAIKDLVQKIEPLDAPTRQAVNRAASPLQQGTNEILLAGDEDDPDYSDISKRLEEIGNAPQPEHCLPEALTALKRLAKAVKTVLARADAQKKIKGTPRGAAKDQIRYDVALLACRYWLNATGELPKGGNKKNKNAIHRLVAEIYHIMKIGGGTEGPVEAAIEILKGGE